MVKGVRVSETRLAILSPGLMGHPDVRSDCFDCSDEHSSGACYRIMVLASESTISFMIFAISSLS